MTKVFSLFASLLSMFVMGIWNLGGLAAKFVLTAYERLTFVRSIRDPRRDKTYRFITPNRLTFWRSETFFSKEPETLEWLDAIKPGSVLYDIGGNIGVYTVYAGVNGNAAKVISFEPESSNYALLNANVAINGVADRVTCLNIALSNEKKMDYLYLGGSEVGNALHSFGQQSSGNGAHKQGAIAYSLDQFIKEFNPPFPNYIKIDVDGLEGKIIEGARATLADPRLKSLQIEIDEGLEENAAIRRVIESAGLTFKQKKHAPMFDNGPYAKVFNYVFVR